MSDETNTIATGKEAVVNDKNCLNRIAYFINTFRINVVVLGYPLSLNGSKTNQTGEVEKFEEMLRQKISSSVKHHVDIRRWDERFTSRMASDSMIISGMKKKKRKDKSNIDIISAALLLQSYLDSLS